MPSIPFHVERGLRPVTKADGIRPSHAVLASTWSSHRLRRHPGRRAGRAPRASTARPCSTPTPLNVQFVQDRHAPTHVDATACTSRLTERFHVETGATTVRMKHEPDERAPDESPREKRHGHHAAPFACA